MKSSYFVTGYKSNYSSNSPQVFQFPKKDDLKWFRGQISNYVLRKCIRQETKNHLTLSKDVSTNIVPKIDNYYSNVIDRVFLKYPPEFVTNILRTPPPPGWVTSLMDAP